MAGDPATNPPQPAAPLRRGVPQARPRRLPGTIEKSRTSGLAYGLFIVFIVFTLLSVPSRVPVIGFVRPTVLLVVAITALILLTSGTQKHRDTSKTTRLLTLFIVYLVVTIPFVQWPGSVLRFGIEGFIKAAVFFYFTVQLVDTFGRLRVLVMTVLACQVWRVLEPLYLNLTTGYWGSRAHMGGADFMARLSGAPHDIINPNGLAFVILTALPFLHYVVAGAPGKLGKVLYAVLAPILLYAFVLTGSRSGLVGLLVIAGVIVYRSRNRATLIVAAAVAATLLAGVMSSDLKDRYMSLVDVETQHAATRQGRLQGVKNDILVGMRRPIFGHGLGTSREALANFGGRDQISHNLYTEVFIETGVIGLLLYIALLASIMSNVRSVRPAIEKLERALGATRDRRLAANLHFCRRCADATLTWVIMCLVFSLASYGLSEFYWYMTAGLSVSLLTLVIPMERQLSSRHGQVPALASASASK